MKKQTFDNRERQWKNESRTSSLLHLIHKKTFTNPHFMLKFVKVLLIHDYMTVHLMDGHNFIFFKFFNLSNKGMKKDKKI